MIPEERIPTHPGVVHAQEFLAPLGISQVALAAHLGVPVQIERDDVAALGAAGAVTVVLPGGTLEIVVGEDYAMTMLGPVGKVMEGTIAGEVVGEAG